MLLRKPPKFCKKQNRHTIETNAYFFAISQERIHSRFILEVT